MNGYNMIESKCTNLENESGHGLCLDTTNNKTP